MPDGLTETPSTPGTGRALAALAWTASARPPFAELTRAADAVVQQTIGRAYTTLRAVLDHGAGYRAFTSLPDRYPLGGGKPFAQTAWRQHTLIEGRQFMAADPAAIVATYPDSKLVLELGAHCLVNTPIFGRGGEVIGLWNVAGATTYDTAGLDLLTSVAAMLGPALAAERPRLQAELDHPPRSA